MKVTPSFRQKLLKLLNAQNGILTTDDLWTILCPTSSVDFYRQLKKLINDGLLSRFNRSFYVREGYSKAHLVMAIRPESYLSLEYALANHNMIGTYTEYRISPIVPSPVRTINNTLFKIEFKTLSPSLFFGIDVVDGVKVASKEKAFLDTLYFYIKGTKFYFDIYSDIDTSELDRKLLFKYLKKYKNPKFIKFVEGYFEDK